MKALNNGNGYHRLRLVAGREAVFFTYVLAGAGKCVTVYECDGDKRLPMFKTCDDDGIVLALGFFEDAVNGERIIDALRALPCDENKQFQLTELQIRALVAPPPPPKDD